MAPQISAFRRQVNETDALHRSAMRDARRSFLRNATLASVGAVGVGVLAGTGTAAAQEAASSTATVARGLASFEKTAEQVYATAIEAALIPEGPLLDAATLFQTHHADHGMAFSALAGTDYETEISLLEDVFDDVVRQATDVNANVLEIAATLEKQAGDTYNELVGALDLGSPEAANLVGTIASIAPVEYAHWALLTQADDGDVVQLITSLNNFGSTADSIAARLSE